VAQHRFFVPPAAVQHGQVRLPADLSHQVARVLRLRPGDEIVVLDGSGREYAARLVRADPRETSAEIVATRLSRGEPALHITLYQALLPREKFELALQKGTEVGISAFVPVQTARSLAGTEAVTGEKLERWRRIVREAAEQSERGRVPVVEPAERFPEAVRQAVRVGPALLAWERDNQHGPREILARLPSAGELALFIGPEGGFTAEEVEQALAAGATPIGLGPRILRAETAGPVLAMLALFATGNLEPR